jgi:hypothetical protein
LDSALERMFLFELPFHGLKVAIVDTIYCVKSLRRNADA